DDGPGPCLGDVDAFGEQAPRNILVDVNLRVGMPIEIDIKDPALVLSRYAPVAARVSADGKGGQGPIARFDARVRMRQSAQECIEHRMEIARFLQSRHSYGIADLLLMVPSFSIFSGEIEPDRRRFRAGPAYRVPNRKRIERFKITAHLRSGE